MPGCKECARAVHAKGLCSLHYKRANKQTVKNRSFDAQEVCEAANLFEELFALGRVLPPGALRVRRKFLHMQRELGHEPSVTFRDLKVSAIDREIEKLFELRRRALKE